MAGVLHLWNEWAIQILVLVSFALQVFLLIFARMRRRRINPVLRILLWLMYLLAEFTATYALGHLSISSTPGGPQQQLMAFWAPFLLVHLGGQDTITAYAMEDNQLWLRHFLTFSVQAIGVAYVLYKYIGNRGPLVVPAVLMFLVGVVKNGERVWALSFSRLEMIRKYLDGVSIKQRDGPYSARTWLVHMRGLDAESILQGAHDLLYICMGQFVDDKVWPSKFQSDALKLFHEKRRTFELIEMQLSLMYDIFYTKVAVIHTWYGCCIRAISFLGTIMAFFLFQFSTGKDDYNRVDAVVTNILGIGAIILETASVFRMMGSTWTCAKLKEWKWDRLHHLHVSLRRCIRIAQTRRWPGSTGQLNLLDPYITDDTRSPRSNVTSFWKNSSSKIPAGVKQLVLKEILRMAKACGGKEDIMRSYRGQCALKRPDGFLADLLAWSTDMEFDQSILAWHLATNKFLKYSTCSEAGTNMEGTKVLVEATKMVSNYMMFLLVEHPYMLPSPVRSTLHLKAKKELMVWHKWFIRKNSDINHDAEERPVLDPGAKIARVLLTKESIMPEADRLEVLKVVFGVWVEMLSYAAHHSGRESHAKQLNSGGELITAVWLLTTAEFNRIHCRDRHFKEREHGSFWNFMNLVDFREFMNYILMVLRYCFLCPYLCVCFCDMLLEILLELGGYHCFFCCLPSEYRDDLEDGRS